MRDIILKITGKQIDDMFEEEQIEFVTVGKLFKRNGALFLIYEESEVSGEPGYKTSLRLKDDTLFMKRSGPNAESDDGIEFKEGKKYSGYYDTPYGAVGLEVLTNSVKSDIGDDGRGTIDIDYHISLGGVTDNRNILNIEIS